jgi:hypothetical protein
MRCTFPFESPYVAKSERQVTRNGSLTENAEQADRHPEEFRMAELRELNTKPNGSSDLIRTIQPDRLTHG